MIEQISNAFMLSFYCHL